MIRIALVGCGRISKSHTAAIKELEKERQGHLVACCDIIAERAQATAEAYGGGCRAFSNYAEMLKEIDCDLVALCTPSGLHPKHAIQAAEAGRHVLSEKPLGTSLQAVDEAIAACDEAGVHYLEVKQNRLNPTIILLRRALEADGSGGST